MTQFAIIERIGKFIVIENSEEKFETVVYEIEKQNITEKDLDEIMLQNGFAQRALDIRTIEEKVYTVFHDCYKDVISHTICEVKYKG